MIIGLMVIASWILVYAIPFIVEVIMNHKATAFGGTVWRKQLDADIARLESELGMSDKVEEIVPKLHGQTQHTVFDGSGQIVRQWTV